MVNINSMHYTLRTTSMSGTFINAVAIYDVYYDASRGIAYEVELSGSEISQEEAAQLPSTNLGTQGPTTPPVPVPMDGQAGMTPGVTGTVGQSGMVPVEDQPFDATQPMRQQGTTPATPTPGTTPVTPITPTTPATPAPTPTAANVPGPSAPTPAAQLPGIAQTAPVSPTPTTTTGQIGAVQITPEQVGIVTTQPQQPVTPVVPTTEMGILPMQLSTIWRARIVNYIGQLRLEYDILKRIFYRTRQIIDVESPLYQLQEDIRKFLAAAPQPVEPMSYGGKTYPGYRLNTLTIWIDPDWLIPIRRVNNDRGYNIIDDFVYQSINSPLPAEVFVLNKPAEAIADFNLYPEAPSMSRFNTILEQDEVPQYGIYVQTLLNEIKHQTLLNQWLFGPFATILLPWLVEMPVTIYRNTERQVTPPIVVAVEAPRQGTTYFLISYDFLGYVVTGHTTSPYDLNGFEQLPINASLTLRDFVPLFQAPSFEKQWVVDNFITSVQSNDYFINIFRMGGKTFDMTINNFSFHDNEGYLLLNVYGKEYWDNANLEAMFNFITTGNMVDAHTTPIQIYSLNAFKRLGIFQRIRMPIYQQVPGT